MEPAQGHITIVCNNDIFAFLFQDENWSTTIYKDDIFKTFVHGNIEDFIASVLNLQRDDSSRNSVTVLPSAHSFSDGTGTPKTDVIEKKHSDTFFFEERNSELIPDVKNTEVIDTETQKSGKDRSYTKTMNAINDLDIKYHSLDTEKLEPIDKFATHVVFQILSATYHFINLDKNVDVETNSLETQIPIAEKQENSKNFKERSFDSELKLEHVLDATYGSLPELNSLSVTNQSTSTPEFESSFELKYQEDVPIICQTGSKHILDTKEDSVQNVTISSVSTRSKSDSVTRTDSEVTSPLSLDGYADKLSGFVLKDVYSNFVGCDTMRSNGCRSPSIYLEDPGKSIQLAIEAVLSMVNRIKDFSLDICKSTSDMVDEIRASNCFHRQKRKYRAEGMAVTKADISRDENMNIVHESLAPENINEKSINDTESSKSTITSEKDSQTTSDANTLSPSSNSAIICDDKILMTFCESLSYEVVRLAIVEMNAPLNQRTNFVLAVMTDPQEKNVSFPENEEFSVPESVKYSNSSASSDSKLHNTSASGDNSSSNLPVCIDDMYSNILASTDTESLGPSISDDNTLADLWTSGNGKPSDLPASNEESEALSIFVHHGGNIFEEEASSDNPHNSKELSICNPSDPHVVAVKEQDLRSDLADGLATSVQGLDFEKYASLISQASVSNVFSHLAGKSGITRKIIWPLDSRLRDGTATSNRNQLLHLLLQCAAISTLGKSVAVLVQPLECSQVSMFSC